MSDHDSKPTQDPGAAWQPLTDFAGQRQQDSGLKAWLAVINGCIRAIETAAWQGRGLADQAFRACQAIGRGANAVNEEMQQLADEARRWPARLKRLSITGWMLTKILTSYRLWNTRSAFLPASMREKALMTLHERNAQRFLDTSQKQGGAFLKIGQLLSSRPDLLPQPWVDALAVLQDQVSPISFEDVRTVIEGDFDQPLEQLFAEFDPAPLAAASIGQVHRARLKDGTEVAVKVQRPGLDELVELDMAILKVFVDAVKSSLPPMDTDTIVREIQRTVREELDYKREARILDSIGNQLKTIEGVTTPALVPALSTRHVLTTEFAKGRKLTLVLDELVRDNPAALNLTLHRLLDAWFSQVLHGGHFHADPHPGNIMVSDHGELVLLDFGCSQAISREARHGYFRVLQACVVNEPAVIAETLNTLGFRTRSGQPDTLLAFVSAILDQVRDAIINPEQQDGWPSSEDIMQQLADLLGQLEHDPVESMPDDFIMLARVFGTLGGLFLHYQPDIDIAGLMLGYLTKPIDSHPQQAAA